MNKSRETIINIIEPYMNKTLSEGCFMKSKVGGVICDFKKINPIAIGKFKILGHYDITAVLKYIQSKKGPNFFIHSEGYIQIEELETPNKPLHLYSEEEEKDLLKLLNKLK